MFGIFVQSCAQFTKIAMVGNSAPFAEMAAGKPCAVVWKSMFAGKRITPGFQKVARTRWPA